MCGFRYYFTPLTGVLFTNFARATGSLSVTEEYLALADGPARFKPGFACPTLLGYLFGRSEPFTYGAITRYGAAFQKLRLDSNFVTSAGVQAPGRDPTTPHAQRSGLTCMRFRLSPVRSPLLGTSMALSFPGVTKMFQFTPLASVDYEFIAGSCGIDPHGVPAFRNLRVTGC